MKINHKLRAIRNSLEWSYEEGGLSRHSEGEWIKTVLDCLDELITELEPKPSKEAPKEMIGKEAPKEMIGICEQKEPYGVLRRYYVEVDSDFVYLSREVYQTVAEQWVRLGTYKITPALAFGLSRDLEVAANRFPDDDE